MTVPAAVRRSLFLPLAALAAATVVLVPPVGDFPLNDDWVYASMAKTLWAEHRFLPHPFAAAYAILQSFWGAGFAVAFGPSYTALRASTLVLALAAAWLAARCAREAGATRGMALLCGAALWANPLFLNLSYTFMTEVPYLAPMMASGLFYLRALRRGRAADVLLGSVFAVLAFSNRQYGVLSTAAFAAALIAAFRAPLRRPRIAHTAAFAGPWIAVAFVYVLLGTAPDSPFRRIGLAGDISIVKQIAIVLNVVFSTPLYVGLFLLPAAAAIAASTRRWRRAQWLLCVGIAVPYALLFLAGVQPLPRLPNMLRDVGVGPLTLHDAYFANRGWSPVTFPAGPWRGVTIVCAVSAGVLAAHWFGRLTCGTARRARYGHPVRRAQYCFLFFWGVMLLFSPLNPALTIYFDRYLLPGCVPLLVLAAASVRGRSRTAIVAAAVPLAVVYVFSLVCVQDYLAWNCARWDAIALLRSKYSAANEQIDGGYEFNGVYTSERFRALHPDKPMSYTGERPWWVIDGVYAVSFLPRDGYAEIDRVPYTSWLYGGAHLLVLERGP